MGRYLKGRGKLQQREWTGFESHSHMVHFLTKAKQDDKRWQTVAVRTAKDFLDERKVPQFKILRNDLRKIRDHQPQVLAGELMHEFRRSQGHVGGGLHEAVHSVFSEGAHLLGLDALANWVGLGPKHVPMSDKEQDIAAAVQQSYKSIQDRGSSVGGFTRLPEYDSDRLSVWSQPERKLLVTVHGTTLKWSDIRDDWHILTGDEARSKELTTLLQKLDSQGLKYDLAGHSLATQFITNAVRDGQASNVQDSYLFNPASSPFQGVDYLRENANDPRFTYFLNQGDTVSSGLYQQFSDESMERVHVSGYRWDPISAHSLGQWVDEKTEKEAEAAQNQQGSEARKTGWTVNFNRD